MKQKIRVYQYLLENGSITSLESVRELGVLCLQHKIAELRKDGICINDSWETAPNRYGEKVSFKRYYLGE